MKNLYFFIFIIGFIYSEAQDLAIPDIHHHCSKYKSGKYKLFLEKEIIQSPLLHNYDVKFYFLDLNVENNSVAVSGNVSIHANVIVNELDTFAFELINDLEIDSVLFNGVFSGFSRIGDEVFVKVESPPVQNEKFICQVFYHGTPPTGGFFRGISTKYDTLWDKHVTWTLSEPFNARQWWPTKQVLTDKADSAWVFITTSSGNKAGSVGLLTKITALPDNKSRYEWKSKYPIAYYLISVAVSEYQEYNIYAKPKGLNEDSILIQNFIYDSPGCLSHYKQGIDNTKIFLELFSELFSSYPFKDEKYGHCLAGLGGGMEHQTMTTIGGFSFSLVAHELGHMWFGDNVTCSNWSDIWINEGFATYADYLATEKIAGDPWPGIWRKNVHNFILSKPDGSTYVPPEEVTYENVERIFDSRLTYWKGAVILHMIRFELQNDKLFFDVLKTFQEKYANSTASTPDFINVLNEISGKDFNEFFYQWYYGEGYPIYNISYKQTTEFLELGSVQTSSMPDLTPFFKMNIPFTLFFKDGSDTTIILLQGKNNMTFLIPTEKIIDSIQLDPEKWVLKKVESITNINENDGVNPFTLSPNPVNKELVLHCSCNMIQKIILYDIYGNKLNEYTFMQPISTVDVSGLCPGIYFITITNGVDRFTRKFIKQ